MTDLLHDIDAPSDAELISRVRGGDVAAYGELFARHVDAARRLARQLLRGPDADDLVSDAFAKVLGVLQGGGGPDVAFRAYLLTAVRRLHVDTIRAGAKLQASDDMDVFDGGVPFQDTAVAAFESGAAAKAFASLPERWQLVLWHLEVEGQKPAEIAPLLGMSANSVSALAYRAREGLRQAFLTMHLNDTSETSCRWVNEHLGAYVRNGLAKRDAGKVQTHLDECRRCTAMYLELTEVNSNLRGIIAPLLLGAAAAGYLSSTGAAAGGGFGLVSLFGRARDVVTANAGAATAGAVAAGVAAIATAGIMLLPSSGPQDTVTGADDPIGTVTTPGVPDGDGGPAGGEEPAGGPDDGTAASEEPALDADPDDVPVGNAGVQPVADGGTADGGATNGESTDPGAGGPGPGPNEPPAEEPPGEQPPGEEPPGEEPPGEEPPGEQPPGEQPPGEQPPGEQPPGEQPPGEEPPGEQPPGEEPVTYTLQVTALRVEDGQVSFDFEGVLPPVVYLSVQSEPATVLFTDGGTCEVEAAGTTATCDLAGARTLLAPLARIAAAVTEEPFVSAATVGLTTPTEDSDVTITMAATPGGPALDTETFEVKAPLTEQVNAGVTVVKDQPTNSNSGRADLLVEVTSTHPDVPITLTGTFNTAFIEGTLPETCAVVGSEVRCVGTGSRTLVFGVDVDRVRNETRSERFVFTVTVPKPYEDTVPEDDTAWVEVERFGDDRGGGNDGGPEVTVQRVTVNGLTPSATTSPAARTLSPAAETVTSLARDVRDARPRPTAPRLSTTTPTPPKTATTMATAASAGNAGQERTTSSSHGRTSPAGDAKPSTQDGGLPDTVVETVKNVL